MKKIALCIIPLIMVLMGCVSTVTAVAETNGNSPGLDLDVAIREAAAQMGENLPGGTHVALVSIASSSVQLSEYVISRLEAALVRSKKLVVVDRANLDRVREEQGFQLSGEVDDNSAKAIGKILGAGAIVTGAFTNLGDVYSLTVKAINIETATVAVSYPADIVKSTRIETMLASGGGAAGTQPAQRGNIGGNTTVPAARPAASLPAEMAAADGTYTFNPRIQAFQGARSVAVYLDKIVIRRGYMTISIFNTPEGGGSGYGSSLIGNWKSASLKDMDNNRSGKLVQAVPNGPPYGSVAEYDLTYQNFTGTRFTLTSSDNPPIEFYDVVLEQPDNY